MSKILLKIKSFNNNHHAVSVMKIVITIIISISITIALLAGSYSENLNKGLADNLIRLHVIANSDSPEDQALKRDVRDIILSYMKEQLINSKDIEQTRYIINTNIKKIIVLAKDEIGQQGRNYDVNVTLGSYPFPTKAYGDIALPAGNYQALRVVIGKGEGANWWCVLFPPLCFVDVTHGTVPDSVKENLKKALTTEEYSIIASAEYDNEIPIKIKFKVVELFQNSKIRFTGMINKIFNTSR